MWRRWSWRRRAANAAAVGATQGAVDASPATADGVNRALLVMAVGDLAAVRRVSGRWHVETHPRASAPRVEAHESLILLHPAADPSDRWFGPVVADGSVTVSCTDADLRLDFIAGGSMMEAHAMFWTFA